MRQLPTEARRFNSVDQLWKKVRLRVLESGQSLPSQFSRLRTKQARIRRGCGIVPSHTGRVINVLLVVAPHGGVVVYQVS